MDVGPAKVRRRTSAGVRDFTISLVMNRAELALLDEFFVSTTQSGTEPFQWKHPRTGNLIDYRFLSRPQYTPLGPRNVAASKWTVTFQLEALPGTEITDIIPPIDPIAIPANASVFVIEGHSGDALEVDGEFFAGAFREADSLPPDIFIGSYIDVEIEGAESSDQFAGAALFTNTGGSVGPGSGGDHGGGPGGGFPQP